ncbi:Bug family tripartite tricarboxylate transporter substrate binding protein [Roseomonas sp. BN140053]|uniref:Bug family tripartite tricarboxylate transporter substrate binding protein n=1 Tax=Roseomonas sp. BN140053 TaxID=3391898 RepID=UPI0039E9A663
MSANDEALGAQGASGTRTGLTRRTALAGLAAALGGPALAQSGEAWPSRPVRIIAPFAPGGSADTLGRLVGQELSQSLKQPFVVENRPGGGGVLGSSAVARAAPDGYNLLISGIASHVIAPAIGSGADYDGVRSFTHVAYLGGPPIALVVRVADPARTLPDFIQASRRGQSKSFSSPGVGTHGHLIGEMFRQAANAGLEHVPYRGGNNSISDLLGGVLDCGFMALPSAAGSIRGGQLRALAVSSQERLPAFPEVPTFRESGYPDLVATTWFGLSGPAGLAPAIAEKLNEEVRRILALPAMVQRLNDEGAVSRPLTVAEFTRFVQEETERWVPIARASGAQAQ